MREVRRGQRRGNPGDDCERGAENKDEGIDGLTIGVEVKQEIRVEATCVCVWDTVT
jgi:hypothetical protein